MKPVVSSLVALAIALAPLTALAETPAPHAHHNKAHAAKVHKADKSAKADKEKENAPIVHVKANTSKSEHGKKGALKPAVMHHAHNVDLGGAGHSEPKVDSSSAAKEGGNSAIVPASMMSKIAPSTKAHTKADKDKKADKELPKLPSTKNAKPSKGGAEKGAARKPAEKKSDSSADANDGEPARDEEIAELVARIRGVHSSTASSGTTEKNDSGSSTKNDKKIEKLDKPEGTELLERSSAKEPIADPNAKDAKATREAKGSSRSSKSPCVKDPVEIIRGPEMEKFELTKCDGSLAPLAVEHLSILIRPGGIARPVAPLAELAKKSGAEIGHGIRRVEPKLIDRIQSVADHFGKPNAPAKILIVSGYRPASVGSMHSSGRAIDFRVDGVKNEDVVSFCKTLNDTGCGFYPNSSFVHLDVRDTGAGHVSWIDASGPGETPRYVEQWPPPPSSASRAIEKASANHGPDSDLAKEGETLLRAKRPLDREATPDAVDEHPSDVAQ